MRDLTKLSLRGTMKAISFICVIIMLNVQKIHCEDTDESHKEI